MWKTTSLISVAPSRMLTLLQLSVVLASFSLAAAQTPISLSTTTSTTSPTTVAVGKSTSSSIANSIKLTVSASMVYSGNQMNFTCTFKSLPKTDNIFFVMNTNYVSRTIAQVSTRLMAAVLPIDIRQRMNIFLLDDGVSLLFEYFNTMVADTGVYRCYVGGGASSNSVSVTVVNKQQPSILTTQQPITVSSTTTPNAIVMPYSYSNFDYDVLATASVNIPLVITITIGSACVITACILFVLRLKYRERFCRSCKTRPQQPPSYIVSHSNGSSNVGGSTNPVYAVDAEQLPSYVDAIKIADQFMPPSYSDVMTSPAVPSAPVAPTPERCPTNNV